MGGIPTAAWRICAPHIRADFARNLPPGQWFGDSGWMVGVWRDKSSCLKQLRDLIARSLAGRLTRIPGPASYYLKVVNYRLPHLIIFSYGLCTDASGRRSLWCV